MGTALRWWRRWEGRRRPSRGSLRRRHQRRALHPRHRLLSGVLGTGRHPGSAVVLILGGTAGAVEEHDKWRWPVHRLPSWDVEERGAALAQLERAHARRGLGGHPRFSGTSGESPILRGGAEGRVASPPASRRRLRPEAQERSSNVIAVTSERNRRRGSPECRRSIIRPPLPGRGATHHHRARPVRRRAPPALRGANPAV